MSLETAKRTGWFSRTVKRHWLTVAFLLGFVIDNITLNNVEQLFDNLVLFTYVVLAMGSLLLLYAGSAERLPEKFNPLARRYAPLLVQFAFGGLLSGMLIFYSRSGAWMESWPFLAVILAVIFGNETIKNRANRFIFNLSILFVGLTSYVVLIVPVLTGYMGVGVFLGSGVIALLIMVGFVKLLGKIVPRFVELQWRLTVFVIGFLYVGFNFLYFLNIIPPIPLSLKDLGIYHSVVRLDGVGYQVKYEKGGWWQWFKDSDDTFHPTLANEEVFCFAQVFAPTRLSTDIFHRWEYWDENVGGWREHARLSYPIQGGRGGGFRGYTLIQNYTDGRWRCTVETRRGQVLGREEFVIDSASPPRELVTEVK